ncbi:MAG: cytochrome c [Chloroflexi bacterium]|nr:cytochrome c [Chloroflexota bacterium]
MSRKPFALLLALVLVTACGTLAQPAVNQPLAVTPLPVNGTLQATPAPDVVSADSAPPATAVLPGDPAEGERLFTTVHPVAGAACSTCHRADSEQRLVGPGLLNIGARAAQRVPGESALDYIRTSIVKPSAYVVDGYPDIMPKNWGKVFSDDELNDLIAYLLTLEAPVVASR